MHDETLDHSRGDDSLLGIEIATEVRRASGVVGLPSKTEEEEEEERGRALTR